MRSVILLSAIILCVISDYSNCNYDRFHYDVVINIVTMKSVVL